MAANRLQSLTTDQGRQALAQTRLVATDMDGTLTQFGEFNDALLITLEQLKTAGMPVLITTG
ncbi:MAG: HAD family hydrolase, partial [Cyanobacteria bacterium P01_C01_bin.118]